MVPLAYAVVIVVWSTTPLAIQYSNDSVSFITAVGLRMLLGAALALLLNKLLGLPLSLRLAWRSYIGGAVGFFAAMFSVYWAAQFISSGLIAVVYGTAPLISGVLAWAFLQERELTRVRVLMLFIAVAGLVIVFQGELLAAEDGWRLAKGIGGVLLSTVLFCISAVLIKKEQQLGRTAGHPLTQTAGALLFTAPAYVVVWLAVDQQWPIDISVKSILAISYLGVFGSVLGFLCYFYVLQKLNPEKVALITLITPVIALAIGYVIENEPLTWSTAVGTAVILLAMMVYQRTGPKPRPVPLAPNLSQEREE